MSYFERRSKNLREEPAVVGSDDSVLDLPVKRDKSEQPTGGQMWAVSQGRNYVPCEMSVDTLPPGQYTINHSDSMGIYFTHKIVATDELLQLPDGNTENVISTISNFWERRDQFKEMGFLWKRGILLWGPPGSGKCLAKGTNIIMFDGTIKQVEDVEVGDKLMGDDSTARTVLSLARGQEQMYTVHQQNGDSYSVNESHILSLVDNKSDQVVDINVLDYINGDVEYHGYKVAVDFPRIELPSNISPYQLGLSCATRTLPIPRMLTTSSRGNRMLTLGGVIDGMGELQDGGDVDIFTHCTELADDIAFLARSLGFVVSLTDTGTRYYHINISGAIHTVPTRKVWLPSKSDRVPSLTTPITIEPIGLGDYYGFEIDGNKRFLLGDFTVTHNTSCLQQISQMFEDLGGISVYCDYPSLGARGLHLIRTIEPDRPVVCLLEDIDSIIDRHGESELLALLDGELQVDNVVFIATTNYPELLDPRLVNRPSRFDEIIYIGMPSYEARVQFLLNKNPSLAGEDNLDQLHHWAELTNGYSIAHMKELIVAVECLGRPLDESAARLRSMIDSPISSTSSPDKRQFGFVANK